MKTITVPLPRVVEWSHTSDRYSNFVGQEGYAFFPDYRIPSVAVSERDRHYGRRPVAVIEADGEQYAVSLTALRRAAQQGIQPGETAEVEVLYRL
jgi:hypothetical protein